MKITKSFKKKYNIYINKTIKQKGGVKITEEDGVYDGDVFRNKKEGEGTKRYTNGDVYEGQWRVGKRDDLGIMTFANGDVYDGEWFNDTMYGYGTMTYANGDVYDGQWMDNKKHGYGSTMKYANGDVYKGEWLNDMINKGGKMTYANGDIYEGNWLNGKKNGDGMMRYANGGLYEGNWVNDKKHGVGDMIYANRNSYHGYWSNDMKNGRGRMTYANGDVYEGNWENDMKSGRGRMTYANGTMFNGDWANDEPVRNMNVNVENEVDVNEIHKRFDKLIEKNKYYYEIIDPFLKKTVEEYAEAPSPVTDMYKRFTDYIDKKFTDGTYTEEKKNELKQKIKAIIKRIRPTTYIKDAENKILIGKTVDFIFALGDDNFVQTYLELFIQDCFHAYNYTTTGPLDEANMSCPKGIVERVFTVVGTAAFTVCPETCSDKPHRETYNKLKVLFGTKIIDKNELLQKWSARFSDEDFMNLTVAQRKQNFIDFMTKEYDDVGLYNQKIRDDILKDAETYNTVFETLEFGGSKKRRNTRKRRVRKSCKTKSRR